MGGALQGGRPFMLTAARCPLSQRAASPKWGSGAERFHQVISALGGSGGLGKDGEAEWKRPLGLTWSESCFWWGTRRHDALRWA